MGAIYRDVGFGILESPAFENAWLEVHLAGLTLATRLPCSARTQTAQVVTFVTIINPRGSEDRRLLKFGAGRPAESLVSKPHLWPFSYSWSRQWASQMMDNCRSRCCRWLASHSSGLHGGT